MTVSDAVLKSCELWDTTQSNVIIKTGVGAGFGKERFLEATKREREHFFTNRSVTKKGTETLFWKSFQIKNGTGALNIVYFRTLGKSLLS